MKEPVLIDLPESFDTARLQVRVARAGDGAVHHEAVIESLAELRAATLLAASASSAHTRARTGPRAAVRSRASTARSVFVTGTGSHSAGTFPQTATNLPSRSWI